MSANSQSVESARTPFCPHALFDTCCSSKVFARPPQDMQLEAVPTGDELPCRAAACQGRPRRKPLSGRACAGRLQALGLSSNCSTGTENFARRLLGGGGGRGGSGLGGASPAVPGRLLCGVRVKLCQPALSSHADGEPAQSVSARYPKRGLRASTGDLVPGGQGRVCGAGMRMRIQSAWIGLWWSSQARNPGVVTPGQGGLAAPSLLIDLVALVA